MLIMVINMLITGDIQSLSFIYHFEINLIGFSTSNPLNPNTQRAQLKPNSAMARHLHVLFGLQKALMLFDELLVIAIGVTDVLNTGHAERPGRVTIDVCILYIVVYSCTYNCTYIYIAVI